MLKRFWMGILTILCSIGITIVISYAWFIKGLDVDPLATGSSTEAYYHSGTGTENDPFIITTPRHLYNFAWLQYLGAYNKDKKSGNTFPATYFKVGLNSSITIDMAGWPLPPIGTTQYPFIGNFNGNGSTITNLTTTNKFSEFGDKHPSGVDDKTFEYDNCGAIGFFGSVGAYDNSIISGDDKLGTYTYDTANNKIYHFYLNDTNVHTSRGDTLIGAVAGYVNAKISDVGVIKPHLNIETSAISKLSAKTSNVSDFAVVGYAEAEYTTQKTKTSTIIYNPTYDYSHFNFQGMGNQADWGGSLNFANTYQRIFNIVKETNSTTNKITSNNANFVVGEIQYYKVENGLSVIDKDKINIQNSDNTFVNFANSSTTGVKYVNYNNANGSYLRTSNVGDYDQYMTLTALYKDVIIVTKTEDTENGYTISDTNGDYYLDLTGTRTDGTLNFNCTINNTSSNPRVWVLSGENSGYLYTYFEDDGKKYYLNATTSALSLSSSESNRTTWYYDSVNQGFYFTSDGFNYYLKRYDAKWCITPLYIISDNQGNYIKMNGTDNNTRVVNTKNASEATVWDFTNGGANPSGSARTFFGANVRYLSINDGNLVTSANPYTWSNNNGLYNGTNYIQFKNNYWVADASPSYRIGYSTHYLSTSLNDTTAANAALWNLSGDLFSNDKGGHGTISVRLDGTVNYLGPINGNLGISTTSAVWMNYGNVLYTFGDNQLYVLQYDNGWKLVVEGVVDYYIVDQNNNYLTFNDATSIRNATTPTTLWHFSDTSDYPCGTISCQNNNNTYYLDHNGTNVILSTAANTTWYNDGDGLYCLIGDVKNYLVYDNGWKLVSYTYKISYGTNYLSVDNNGNIITMDEASATNWIFSNFGSNPYGTIYANGYYLYLNDNGLLDTTSNAGNATSFNNDGSKLYDGYNSIQYYNNHWILAKAFNISYNNTYLGFNGNIGTTGSTVWFYYNNQANPSGYIYTIYNNNIYYLYNNGGTLNGNQTNKTNWSNTGSGIHTGENFIQLVNGNWICDTLKYHYISSGNNYLSVNNNKLANSASIANATLWTFSNAGPDPSGVISYNNKYLYAARSWSWDLFGYSYSVSYNNSSSTWVNNSGRLNSNNCGLRLNGTTWDAVASDKGTVFTFIQPLAQTSDVYTYEEVYAQTASLNNGSGYYEGNYNSISLSAVTKRCYTIQVSSKYEINSALATVYTNSGDSFTGNNALPSVYSAIPITTKGDKLQTVPDDYSTGNNYVVDDSNTGYIISGGHEPRKAADLRISYFPQTRNNYPGMPSALISGSYTNKTLGSVYTVAQDGNTYNAKLITESTNNGVQTNDCGFTKYFASKATMQKTLSDDTKLYGAHFMNAPISKNKYIIMPEAKINGDIKTNYQMPEDCIDFTLKSKGIINFFSSYFYYYSDDGGANNCFFSLNEIIRDSNGNMTQIRHILNVYEKKSDGTYVYYYQDPDNTTETGYYTKDRDGNIITVSSFNSSEYNLKFDANWIEDPAKSQANTTNRQNFYGTSGNNYGNKIFYFEIPANVGEYALGSVSKTDASGKVYNGAYILYLDIGANASVVDRTTITQQSDVVNENIKYVNGIQILAASTTYTSDANSCVAVIKASTTGTIAITRTGNTVSFGGTRLDSTYWDDTLTVPDATLNVPRTTSTTKVLKYIDFNNGTNTLYYSTVIDVDETRSFEVREINGKDNPIVVTNESSDDQIKAAAYGLLKIGTGDEAGYGIKDTAEGAITANSFTTTSKVVEYHYTIATSIVTNNGVSYSFDMSVEQVTGTETVGDKTITTGSYTFDDGYTSTHCYKLIGDDITYVFTQIPAGTANTTFVVTTKNDAYIVTINGTTIAVGNYTYTFNTNTIV